MAEQLLIEAQIQAAQDKFRAVLNEPSVPKIYVNAFLSGYNNTDFIVMLECNGKSEAILNLSYSLAKSLAQNILNSVAEIEKQTGRDILTIDAMEQHRRNIEAGRGQSKS